jgi:hypothetical protein
VEGAVIVVEEPVAGGEQDADVVLRVAEQADEAVVGAVEVEGAVEGEGVRGVGEVGAADEEVVVAAAGDERGDELAGEVLLLA